MIPRKRRRRKVTMKYSFQMGRLAIAGIIMAIAFLLTAPVSAKDWHELRDLDDGQLAEKFKNLAETL
jgi:hypothetical protein